MRSVVVDANVLVSFFVDRHEKQRDAADALLQKAEEGEIVAIIPQFVLFEVTYVLQSQYGFNGVPGRSGSRSAATVSRAPCCVRLAAS